MPSVHRIQHILNYSMVEFYVVLNLIYAVRLGTYKTSACEVIVGNLACALWSKLKSCKRKAVKNKNRNYQRSWLMWCVEEL